MEQQLDRELRFHLEVHVKDLIAKGYEPKEALRLAKLNLGGPEQIKEKCCDARGTRWLHDLIQDIQYAMRQLRGNPGFAAVAILTLALGSNTTAIFSAVNPILFEPLPYPNPGRIMMVWYGGSDGTPVTQTFGTYREIAERSRSFETLAVMKSWRPTMTSSNEPVRFNGQSVSASYFQVLGVTPAIGRNFDPSEDRLNGPKVVILSNSFWRSRFSGDGSIVGRQVTLDDSLYTVIGVMPKDFENVLGSAAEAWTPLQS